MSGARDDEGVRYSGSPDSNGDITPAPDVNSLSPRRLPAQSIRIGNRYASGHVEERHVEKLESGYQTASVSQSSQLGSASGRTYSSISPSSPLGSASGHAHSLLTRPNIHDLRIKSSSAVNLIPRRADSPFEATLQGRKSSQLGGVSPLTDHVYQIGTRPFLTSDHPPMQPEQLPFPDTQLSPPRQAKGTAGQHTSSLSHSTPAPSTPPPSAPTASCVEGTALSHTPPPSQVDGIAPPSHTPPPPRQAGQYPPLYDEPAPPRLAGLHSPQNDQPGLGSQEQHPPYRFKVDELTLHNVLFPGSIPGSTATLGPSEEQHPPPADVLVLLTSQRPRFLGNSSEGTATGVPGLDTGLTHADTGLTQA